MGKDTRTQKAAILMEYDGSISYYDWEDPTKLLVKVAPGCEYHDVHDLREPPFIQILPCPYCGVLEDKDHDSKLHINHKLGRPIDDLTGTK